MGTNEKKSDHWITWKTDHYFCHTTDAWKYLTAVLYDGRYHDRRTGGRG